MSLSRLQEAFVFEKIKDWYATDVELYRRAGGAAKNYSAQRSCASEVRNHPAVIEELAKHRTDALEQAIMTREQMLEDLTMIANASIDEVLTFAQTGHEYIDTDTGETLPGQSIVSVKNLTDLSEEAKRLIKSVEQTKYGLKVTLHDPMTARKMLMDMQGFNAPIKTENITANVEVDVSDEELKDRLKTLGFGRNHNQLQTKEI